MKKDHLYIECGCRLHGISFFWEDEINPEEPIFINFWIEEFTARQEGILAKIWTRIKLAYKVLVNGGYFLHEIALKKGDFKRLKEFINQY